MSGRRVAVVISGACCSEFSPLLKERIPSRFVTESSDNVKDETCANEAILDEPARIRGKMRIGKSIARYWAEAVVVVIALLLWAPRLSGPIDLRWDAGVYYVLGRSLATGHGYRILSEPGSPEALQYPPLLPTVVALYQRALGSTDPAIVAPWLRMSYATLFLVYALAVLALGRRYLRAGLAVTAVALCLLQVNTIFLSDVLLTELPFALVSVVFVLVAADSRLASRPRLRETVSFVLAAAGFLLRTAGIALLAAWVVEALARRRWRLALTRGVLAVLPVIAWQSNVARVHRSYEYRHPAYEYQRAPYQFYNVSYADSVGLIDSSRLLPQPVHARVLTLAVHFTTNLGPMLKGLGETISTNEYYWRQLLLNAQQRLLGRQVIPLGVVLVPIICLSALVTAGIIILARRRAWLIVSIVLLSVALIWITPWSDQFQRYLMPLAPFLAVAALLALSQLRAALRTSRRLRPLTVTVGQIALAGLALLALTSQTYTACQLFYQRWRSSANVAYDWGPVSQQYFYYGGRWRAWEAAAAWIRANTPLDAIVATPERHLCYLRTNRRAILPPMEANPTRARHLLEGVPVSYVIIDEIGEMASFGRRYALPAVQGDVVGWPLVYSVDGTQIYKRATGRK